MIPRLCAELHLPAIVCRLLAARGYADPDSAKRFLRPRLDQLHDPATMLGMGAAAERLARAVREHETIFLHGDYDVDGMCSTTLMARVLGALGGTVVPFIPRRIEDGYDLGAAGVRAALAARAAVVVTCDCGTSAVGPIRELTGAGVDVIVTDHHLPGGPLPECLAVLNPKRAGCPYPDKDLAAVGVAFKLAVAVTRLLGGSENLVLGYLDLVALATVADIAPLRGENRVFVRLGLKLLAETRNVGLRALLRSSGLYGKPMTAGRVGYILAPRLNAAGRVAHAMLGVELLMTESESDANRLARELEELNVRRQGIDQATLARARERVALLDLDNTFGIVIAEEGWHPGVIGIVASRIVEDTSRPTILVALDGAEGKGSGRSIPAFDLHAALGECRSLLTRFGGHRAAAGVTLSTGSVEEFALRFDAVARARLTAGDLVPELRIDAEVRLDDVSEELEALLRHFEPLGMGNPGPVFAARGVSLAAPPRVLKNECLRLRVRGDAGGAGREIDAVGWGMAQYANALRAGRAFDIAFRLERDEWQGESRLQAKLAGIRT
ncbi:MAG: single-stranded-DNA-specific exonuclease RecJ [Gemmatimonadaceae bacterium]